MIDTHGRPRPLWFWAWRWLTTALTLAPLTGGAWFTRAWQTDDGLPNNQVTAIVQGRDGYLWVGTAVGLARFDGLKFNPFPNAQPGGNQDQGVMELLPSRAGGLWIQARRGSVVCLRPNLSQADIAAPGLPEERAQAMIEDNEGCLWLAYPDSIWRVNGGRATRFCGYETMRSTGSVGRFVIDSDGHLWISKGTSTYLLRGERFEAIANTPYRAHLEASRAQGVWIAAGKQLFKCYTNGVLQDCGSFSTADGHAGSTAILEDHAGAVWIGTSSAGLFRYNGAGFEIMETSHPYILSLAEDREGNVWAGTAGGGLDRLNQRGVQLETLNDQSGSAAIQSVCQDTGGMLWGATQNGRLVQRLAGKWVPALTNAPWTDAVDCVAADLRGALWAGVRNTGVYRWQEGRFDRWSSEQGFAGKVVLSLLPTANGDMWIGEQAPTVLQCLREGKLHSWKMPRAAGRITALAQDSAGTIWVGTEMGALLRVDQNHLVREPALRGTSECSILCLYGTLDGALWIGFEGAGVGRLAGGRFTQVRKGQGLFDDYISEMAADDDGGFWFGGERGIFRVREQELESVMAGHSSSVRSINYGQNEGLFSIEANSANISPFVTPRALRSRDGMLWLPTRKALAVVDAKAMRARGEPPVPLLTQIILDGQTIASYGSCATQTTVNLSAPHPALRLAPAHRHLQFQFTAINLTEPENVRFRYQLVGFDDDWIEAGQGRTADYSRLVAGNYGFRVESALGEGPWNEVPTTVALSVPPFWWQTWWFRLGCIALFTSIVIAAVRYISFRRLQVMMRQIEQRATLDKERARIARDLHDDLGCSLNKVALTLDMAQREIGAASGVNGTFKHCSGIVRQAARSVDEIVWAINPRNDTLRYMVDYISQFAVEFLHAADIPCRIELPDNIPNSIVSPEARHNVFLVVKEALNNVVRHAHAKEVRLCITAGRQELAITLEDDGRGFEMPADNALCDGLRNMRQRMQEIGGHFQLTTRPGAGTRVVFRYPGPFTLEAEGTQTCHGGFSAVVVHHAQRHDK